ncbi:GAF and ANTAR domain-containing protein [soil metagenome]
MPEIPAGSGPQVEAPSDGVDHRAFWQVLTRFAGTLVEGYDLADVLERVGADIRSVLDVAGAGVMLGDDDGNLRFTSTSDSVLEKLEALQIELDEGPCLRAYRSGEIVVATDLSTDERFPDFGSRAVDAGMSAVYSFPMHIEEAVFGALNLYRREPGDFTDDQVEVGQTFANVATSYLSNARDSEQQTLLTKQLQHALNSRVLIEQAKGFVSARTDLDLPDAFGLIRSYARRNQVKVRDVARDLLHGDLSVDDLRDS